VAARVVPELSRGVAWYGTGTLEYQAHPALARHTQGMPAARRSRGQLRKALRLPAVPLHSIERVAPHLRRDASLSERLARARRAYEPTIGLSFMAITLPDRAFLAPRWTSAVQPRLEASLQKRAPDPAGQAA